MLRKTKDEVNDMIMSVLRKELTDFRRHVDREIDKKVNHDDVVLKLKQSEDTIKAMIGSMGDALVEIVQVLNQSIEENTKAFKAHNEYLQALIKRYDKVIEAASTPPQIRGRKKNL